MTLACEDANIKLVDVVTIADDCVGNNLVEVVSVADVDAEDNVGNSNRFGS